MQSCPQGLVCILLLRSTLMRIRTYRAGRVVPVSWRRLLAHLPLVLLASLAGTPAASQSSAGPVADRFIGAWELVDWRTVDDAGVVRFPYGEEAQGQISYALNGRMSAHLMRPPEDPSDAPPQHLAYWGRFSVDESAGTVTHHVIGADRPNWIGSDQVRGYEFLGNGLMVLSLGSNRLTWERVR